MNHPQQDQSLLSANASFCWAVCLCVHAEKALVHVHHAFCCAVKSHMRVFCVFCRCCPGRGRGRSPGGLLAPPAARHVYKHAPVALTAAAQPPVVLPAPWPLPATPGTGFVGRTDPAGAASLPAPAPPAAACSSSPVLAHGPPQGAPVPLITAAVDGGALPAGCGVAQGEAPAMPPGAPAIPASVKVGLPAALAVAHPEAPARLAATHAEQPSTSGWLAPIVLPAPSRWPPSVGSSPTPVMLPVHGAPPEPARGASAGSAVGAAPPSVGQPLRAALWPQQARSAAPAPVPAFLRLPGASLDPATMRAAAAPAGAPGLPGLLSTLPPAPVPPVVSPGYPALQQGAVPETAPLPLQTLAGAPAPIAAGGLDGSHVGQLPGLMQVPEGAESEGWLPASAYTAAPRPQGLAPVPGASVGAHQDTPMLRSGNLFTGVSTRDMPAAGFLPPTVMAPVPHPSMSDQAAPALAALPVPSVLHAPPGYAAPDLDALPAPPVLPALDLAALDRPAVLAPPVLPRPLDLPMGKKAQRRAAAAAWRSAAAGSPSNNALSQGLENPRSEPLGLAGRGVSALGRAGAPGMQGTGGPPGAAAAAQERSWEDWLGGNALAGSAAGPNTHPGTQTAAELGAPGAKRRKTARGAGRMPGMRRG